MDNKRRPPGRGAGMSLGALSNITPTSTELVAKKSEFDLQKVSSILLSSNSSELNQNFPELLSETSLFSAEGDTRHDSWDEELIAALPGKKTKKRNGFGSLPVRPSRFTDLSRLKLLYGAMLFDCFPEKSILFITITLAGSTFDAIVAFESYSSYFCLRFTQWCRNKFAPWDKSLYLWCFERQQRGALHFHMEIYVPAYLKSKITQTSIQGCARKIQIEISKRTGVDLFSDGYRSRVSNLDFPVVHAEWCSRIGAYLSKKKSKSPLLLRDGTFTSPTRWAGASEHMTKFVGSLSYERVVPVRSIQHVVKAVIAAKAQIRSLVRARSGMKPIFSRLHYEYAPGSFGYQCTVPVGCIAEVISCFELTAGDLEMLAWSGCDGALRDFDASVLFNLSKQKVTFRIGPDGYLQVKFFKQPLTLKERIEQLVVTRNDQERN